MKKIKYLIFLALLLIPVIAYAAENPKVTALTATVSGRTINYSGTMESGAHAVMCKLYDSTNKEVQKLSSAVSSGTFADSFKVTANGEYKIACANYEGGAIKETNVSVEAEDEEITEVNITLKLPKIGDEVTVSGSEQSNTPEATTEDNIIIEGAGWITGIYSEVGDDFSNPFSGTFEADKDYYAGFEIAAKAGYKLSSNLTIKINGETPAEVFAVYNNKTTRFIAKVKATAAEETASDPKETTEEKEDSPKTGDKFIMYASLLSVGVIGFIVVAIIFNKKVKKNS